MNLKNIEEQFEKKVLTIDSSVEKHEVKSYKAYRIKGGQAFFRVYPKMITMLLPYKKIEQQKTKKYNLKDNIDRYPRHELLVRGSCLNQKYIEKDFIELVKEAFRYTRDRQG